MIITLKIFLKHKKKQNMKMNRYKKKNFNPILMNLINKFSF